MRVVPELRCVIDVSCSSASLSSRAEDSFDVLMSVAMKRAPCDAPWTAAYTKLSWYSRHLRRKDEVDVRVEDYKQSVGRRVRN